jgi:hypothetical protein
MQSILTVIESALMQPPIPFNPEQQTLKGWAMYCLRDCGFKVIYAEKGDFAVETRGGDKLYFKLAELSDDLDGRFAWIVRDPATQMIQFIPPQLEG